MEELRTRAIQSVDQLRILVSSRDPSPPVTPVTFEQILALGFEVDELFKRNAEEWKKYLPPLKTVDGKHTQESLHAVSEALRARRLTLESYLHPPK
jgi:hypothetical protein